MSLKLTTLVASDDALLGPLLQNGIRTGPDLTSYNAKSLFKHFPSGTATVYDIERLQSTVAQRMAAACTAGDDGMDATALAPLQTGVDALDALLKGFEAHDIFEIAGPRRSGKTVLLMSIVARELAASVQVNALWVDTNYDFSPERMLRVLQTYATEADDVSSITDRIHVSQCRDLDALYDALDAIAASETRIRYLVIDSIADIFLSLLSSNTFTHGHVLMATFMRHLAACARAHEFTVFIANSSIPSTRAPSQFTHTSSAPALGPLFASLTAGTLWLNSAVDAFGEGNTPAMPENENLIIAELFTSSVSLSGQWRVLKLLSGVRFCAFEAPESVDV